MTEPTGEIKAPPVTGEQFGRIISGDRSTAESALMIDSLAKVPSVLDTIAGKTSKIPDNVTNACLVSLFGETAPTDPGLRKMRDSLKGKMDSLQQTLDTTPLATGDRDNLRDEFKKIILQTPGLSEFFSGLPGDTERNALLDKLIDRGLMQTIARQKYIEAAVVASESGQYQRIKSNHAELRKTEKRLLAEKATLDSALMGKEIPQITVLKQSADRELESIEASITRQHTIIDSLRQKQEAIASQYRGKGKSGNDLTTALNDDDVYKQYAGQITAAETKISEFETKRSQKQTERDNNELILQQNQQRDSVSARLTEVRESIITSEQELGQAREQLLKKISELSINLDKILPESAIESLKQLQAQANKANEVRLTQEAKTKQENGKKDGDMITRAEGELIEALIRRYLQRTTHTARITGRVSDRFRINEAGLRTEFNLLMSGGSSNFVEHLLNNNPGLSTEVLNYLNTNQEARRQFIEKVKGSVFQQVSRDAVQHLQLDERSLRTLASSDEFVKAAEVAITSNEKIKDVVEKITGQKLVGKGAVRRIWERLPAGGLLGVIMMIFGLLGYGLFGIGRKSS